MFISFYGDRKQSWFDGETSNYRWDKPLDIANSQSSI